MAAGYNARTNFLARKMTKERFLRVKRKGKIFERQLKAVADQIDHIVKGYAPTGIISDLGALTGALTRYAEIIEPWAENVAAQMIAEINQRDEQSWIQLGREIGKGLKQELASARMAPTLASLKAEQVKLITSLPTQASERVNKLALEAMVDSGRAQELADDIFNTGNVTRSRAMLIARTEISRTSFAVNAARAEAVDCTHYIWHSSHDSDVRTLHRELDGKIIAYNDPPIADPSGVKAHAGCIWNCRCWPEPIFS